MPETLPVPVAPAEIQDNDRVTAGRALDDALAAARAFALAEKADATRLAYRRDFDHFAGWCRTVDRAPLPAEPATVAAYLADLARTGLKASTIRRRLAAIRHAHKLSGLEPPTGAEPVRAVHRGIRRQLGTRVEQKAPATAAAIAAMLKRIDATTLTGKRDRALILLGFAGALRRSELVGLDVEDLTPAREGLLVQIRRSKTDQEGAGHEVPVPHGTKLKPVEAVRLWLAAAEITAGPVFVRIRRGGHATVDRLTPQSVALIVKARAKAARLDPDLFAGHSLRAGFVTSALESGADVFAAADQGRWRKLETVREYDRRAKAFKNHAGKGFL
ncbi:site-specific integrase [uncultured Methylobacterium sp.]|jgi:site-specific recombinase XerD|uniref:site-specific integrase n=1 Tax=uncultured Methylobacterium sp. TaxID=157278 RepID=UPI0026228713|nr:site-specific integrase [uncultured Methylobacterium sp.]